MSSTATATNSFDMLVDVACERLSQVTQPFCDKMWFLHLKSSQHLRGFILVKAPLPQSGEQQMVSLRAQLKKKQRKSRIG